MAVAHRIAGRGDGFSLHNRGGAGCTCVTYLGNFLMKMCNLFRVSNANVREQNIDLNNLNCKLFLPFDKNVLFWLEAGTSRRAFDKILILLDDVF